MKRLLGLIGYPLSHSFSENYFREKFSHEKITQWEYCAFPIQSINQFGNLLKDYPTLEGLNVTIPYKEQVIPFLDDLSDTAKEISAVNTIKIHRKAGQIHKTGYNTDVYGFARTLDKHNIPREIKTLILGTGGASKAVEWVLKKRGCEVVFVSRKTNKKNCISYSRLEKITLRDFPLVVNTTPLGMYPHTEEKPDIPYHTASTSHVFIDLIYNPGETAFMKNGKKEGAKVVNGLYMLQQQAERAWRIWQQNAD
ncbi:MAG: shikimate dehydrogenase family protein [Bacteroidota bacterium]